MKLDHVLLTKRVGQSQFDPSGLILSLGKRTNLATACCRIAARRQETPSDCPEQAGQPKIACRNLCKGFLHKYTRLALGVVWRGKLDPRKYETRSEFVQQLVGQIGQMGMTSAANLCPSSNWLTGCWPIEPLDCWHNEVDSIGSKLAWTIGWQRHVQRGQERRIVAPISRANWATSCCPIG
jgi:hypothetical protein